MLHRASLAKNFSWVFFLTLLASPAVAHKVQVAEDVGGTLHIEPNDTPKAGESSLAWFALTRKGGEAIPLQQCNCQLTVFSQPRTPDTPPQSPQLKSISAERYQGIPGAEITFPKPGLYQLQLSGTPKTGENFKPFQLKFTITVAAGTLVPKASQEISQLRNPATAVREPSRQGYAPTVAIAAILGLGILWTIWRKLK